MNKKKISSIIYENIKTLFGALIIAILIRSLFFQPFYIPSSSMEPTLLVGDRIFVSKFSYGYSKHSFPFSPNFSSKRFFSQKPKRGDLVVFKTPADNRTDYIKRLIGLPGDTIQFIKGEIFINQTKVMRKKIESRNVTRCGKYFLDTETFIETLPNGIKHFATYKKVGTLKNTKKYKVPKNHYFLMGDNRDCSKDSRYLDSVGYVKNQNLVGEAKLIFFSNDTSKGSLFKIWNLHKSFRLKRTFKNL
jgi:signal peptidase I